MSTKKNELSLEPDVVRGALDDLGEFLTRIDNTALQTLDMPESQTSRRWGGQPVSKTFAAGYTDAIVRERKKMDKARDEVQGILDALEHTLKEVGAMDEDTQMRFDGIQGQLDRGVNYKYTPPRVAGGGPMLV